MTIQLVAEANRMLKFSQQLDPSSFHITSFDLLHKIGTMPMFASM